VANCCPTSAQYAPNCCPTAQLPNCPTAAQYAQSTAQLLLLLLLLPVAKVAALAITLPDLSGKQDYFKHKIRDKNKQYNTSDER
jgi:hypothetical protein